MEFECPTCRKGYGISSLYDKQSFKCECGFEITTHFKERIINKRRTQNFVADIVFYSLLAGIAFGAAISFYDSIGIIFGLLGLYFIYEFAWKEKGSARWIYFTIITTMISWSTTIYLDRLWRFLSAK